MIISHVRAGSMEQQSNEEHSIGVSELAADFASEFGMSEWGHIMGLLHDKGKEQYAFQQHIKKCSGIDALAKVPAEHSHAYVGALIAKQKDSNVYSLIGNPIMGHHRGLYDYLDMKREEERVIPDDVSVPKFTMPKIPQWFTDVSVKKQDFHHIVRLLFSCLVDADFLDTERFMQPEQFKLRGGYASLSELLPKLKDYLSKFGTPITDVNKIRNEIQQACLKRSADKPGFYSLTVPTGGGKTLSSLVWALNHAVKYGKKRIVIAIPYTSIIVQTAAILRSIFGDDNVLEHHSNVNYSDGEYEGVSEQLKLATENWDYPIIVTTNVQLFESMMSNRSSDCRKLHNLCNSVLILDEVQTLPSDFLQPIIDSLDTYQRLFGLSVLFTTASLPVLTGKHQGTNPNVRFMGLESIVEIVPDGANLHDRLRRVQLDIDDTPRTYDEVADMLKLHDRVLCIVNTRSDAKELFDRLPDDGVCIHLSRMMCPTHLSKKIQEMKEALANPKQKIVRVVSTQLIEAGVDIDFPVVYRQEAGLDSVLQAAGRCNREGKLPICTTHVFSLAKEHALPCGFISKCNNARKNMRGEFDWFSPEAMIEYFEQLYSRVNCFDVSGKDFDVMKNYLYKPEELMFETAARKFRLIDDDSISVIVNWGDSLSLVEQLKNDGISYQLMKKLNQYSVNLRKFGFEQMRKSGLIDEVIEGVFVVANAGLYNDQVGLISENKLIEETLII